jgi:haloalkane dehalogenase
MPCRRCAHPTNASTGCPATRSSRTTPRSTTATAGTLRVHYVDEGRRRGARAVLHGEPSWSYLYRHMIPPLVAAGHRVIAPDLVGFGRSDKPTEQSDYTYARHVEWMRELLFDHLDLRDITFFGQDWGGLVGLRLLALDPTASPGWRSATPACRPVTARRATPSWPGRSSPRRPRCSHRVPRQRRLPPRPVPRGHRRLRRAVPRRHLQGRGTDLPDARADQRPTTRRAPTTSRVGGAGLVRQAVPAVLQRQRPGHQGRRRPFLAKVPGAQGQPHVTIEGGGHFLQEDRGPELADLLIGFIGH